MVNSTPIINGNDSRRKKNIMLLINDLTGGGAELVVSNLCRYIDRDLFNVTVCHLKDRGYRGEELSRAGYDICGLPGYIRKKTDYLSFIKLAKLVKEKSIHLIHSHSTDSLIDASLCRLIMPSLKSVHTFHYGNYPKYPWKYLMLERMFSRVPNTLVSVGYEQRRAIQNTFKVKEKRMITIWNGVEVFKESIDDNVCKTINETNRIVLGSISTMIPQKGLSYLLEVADALKKRRNDFVFVIAGDGPLRKELESQCKAMKLEDVVLFLGWVNNPVNRIIPFIDIFVQTSLWEAMSIVVLEAMVVGKPVVATNVGDNIHVIKHGETGFVIEPKNVGGMVEVLDKLIENGNMRRRMGIRSRERYQEYFTVDKMVNQYMDLYGALLNTK